MDPRGGAPSETSLYIKPVGKKEETCPLALKALFWKLGLLPWKAEIMPLHTRTALQECLPSMDRRGGYAGGKTWEKRGKLVERTANTRLYWWLKISDDILAKEQDGFRNEIRTNE
ncbi:hypothetical protein PoB_006338400 [Plakobranchus ocellatus]|uniref:Uncharacterized protein n=1 Tax=Plakobranchus ocellatus TaxID=259542 RepID=A0AAV4CY65_9GAST|nr:hypothetical protein PoB_006338400 [Plakobranchus ocellatus]